MQAKHHNDVWGLIAKNLAGIANTEEVLELESWINRSPDNRQYFEQIRNIWDASEKQLDPEHINASVAFEKILKRIPEIPAGRRFWHYWQKVAAIIIIPLTISLILWFYINKASSFTGEDKTVYYEAFTPVGMRSSLILADSSLVWLNSGSSIRYPMRFNATDRTVYLTGEAYFEVESDESRPFKVCTSTLEVIATGTKFGVTEYDLNPGTEVTLVSGKVTVQESGNDDPHVIAELVPDEHLSYNRDTKTLTSTYGDTYKYISWKDGVLMFRDEPFDSVLWKISQYFNVDIELRSEELKNYRYYATFKEESLEEILRLLKISAPIDYTEVRRIPLPDGTFPRKKVIITQRK